MNWTKEPELARRAAAKFDAGVEKLKARRHDRKVLPRNEAGTTDKPFVPEQDTTPVSSTERDWVERYMKSTGCDQQEAERVYHGGVTREGLTRGNEVLPES